MVFVGFLALVFAQAIFTLPLYLKSIGFGEEVYGSLMALNGILIVFALVTPFHSLFDQKASEWVVQGRFAALV